MLMIRKKSKLRRQSKKFKFPRITPAG